MSNEPSGIKSMFVLWHKESDQYMYAHSDDERDVLCSNCEMMDVTGDIEHEGHAEEQLGPWQIDANERQDDTLVIEGGTLETSEGTLPIPDLLNDVEELAPGIFLVNLEAVASGRVDLGAMLGESENGYTDEERDTLPAESLSENWYFTFGLGHAHPNGFVRIFGTFLEARRQMETRFGSAWAMQYDTAGFAGQEQRYDLKEIT